ncbi:MAG: hypothetical protein VKJ64_10995 [Leptolyngbyaceae bacterium]|nr:hypothetical protein [Leptolyngbyaceae bacterium]
MLVPSEKLGTSIGGSASCLAGARGSSWGTQPEAGHQSHRFWTLMAATYSPDLLPSSLSFESSPRHLKKNPENMHIEESRSHWNPRIVTV